MNAKFTFDGVPWKGPVPFLKDQDSEDYQPEVKYTAQAKVFDLSKEEDLKEYTRVWTKITNGECAGGDTEERQFCESTGSWKVFLRWVDVHMQASKKSLQAFGGYDRK